MTLLLAAEITIVCPALKLLRGNITYVWTQLEAEIIADIVCCQNRNGDETHIHLGHYIARKDALQLLAATNYLHIVVLNARIGLHALVLEADSAHETPVSGEWVIGIHAQTEVRAKGVAVKRADGGRHADRGGAAQVIRHACLILIAVEIFVPGTILVSCP